jgi:hypothetical protein
MRFFVGLHHPADARHIAPAFISVNALRMRKRAFAVGDWILDSGAFSTILKYGGYPLPVQEYAEQVERWKDNGNMLAAVTQDYMCEPAMLALTGLSVAEHQRLTIERYDALLACDTGAYIMPVLQGYMPEDYVTHIDQYGARLKPGMWLGVGSVCKRNGAPELTFRVLNAIKLKRPDLRLHGFGLKTTALYSATIRGLLESADSMAWSYAARKQGRNQNDWREAQAFAALINGQAARHAQLTERQLSLELCEV